MAKYKIGITEAGDAGITRDWVYGMNWVDGAIIITKELSQDCQNTLVAFHHKVILHITATGYGSTVLEPNVPSLDWTIQAVQKLLDRGFSKKKMVIRVDPIIPTPEGIFVAKSVIKKFMDMGFSRYRISLIDMYPHVRERFKQAGLELPYGCNFSPDDYHFQLVDSMIKEVTQYWISRSGMNWFLNPLRIESCAEPKLTQTIQCGCISDYDMKLLGLKSQKVDSSGHQRPDCCCYSGKTELLTQKSQCAHQCLYCYWR